MNNTPLWQEFLNDGRIVEISHEPAKEPFITHIEGGCEGGGEWGNELCTYNEDHNSNNERVLIASSWPSRELHTNIEGTKLYTWEDDNVEYSGYWLDHHEKGTIWVTIEEGCKMFCGYPLPIHGGEKFKVHDGDIEGYLIFKDAEAYRQYCEIEHEGEIWSNAYTQEQWEQKLEEERIAEERKREQQLNDWTVDFCKKEGLVFASNEFFDRLRTKLDADVEHWENRKIGAQEDGLCLGFGCTPEQWYDHMDGLNEGLHGAQNHAWAVWEWCESNLPLPLAKWRQECQLEAV